MQCRKKDKLTESSKTSTKSHFSNFKNIWNKVTLIFNQDYSESNLNWKASQQKMKQMATDLIHSVGKKLNPEKK